MKKLLMLLLLMICLSVFLTARNGERNNVRLPLEDIDEEGHSYEPVVIDTFDSSKNPVRIQFDKVPTRGLVYELNTLETLLAFGQGDKVLSASLNTSGESYARLKEEYPEERYGISRSRRSAESRRLPTSQILFWDGSRHFLRGDTAARIGGRSAA